MIFPIASYMQDHAAVYTPWIVLILTDSTYFSFPKAVMIQGDLVLLFHYFPLLLKPLQFHDLKFIYVHYDEDIWKQLSLL